MKKGTVLKSLKKTFISERKRLIPMILIMALAACMLPSLAWFYEGRKAAAVEAVSTPTSIFINAANEEDIRYMDLSGIDVEDGTYKDFVFCVRGNSIGAYKIQLAYTTNNQFSYELYPATMTTGAVPPGAVGSVVWYTHPEQNTQRYYIPSGTSPLTGTFKNKIDGQILARNADTYYNNTYGSYTNVHQYARPLYWQTDSAILTSLDAEYSFCDYYILRVIWNSSAQNTKETDIIYITARNEAV